MGDNTMIPIGEVISITDFYDGERIKVRIYGVDDGTSNDNLPYAFPLMPKMIHVKPKVGESVLIFFGIDNNMESMRYYVGPIISQGNFINFDSFNLSSTALLDGGKKPPQSPLSKDANAIGALPKDEDIAICGRKNCDILLKDDELQVRSGVHKMDSTNITNVEFNGIDPAFIKLKYHETPLKDEENNKDVKSTATIVANKINLISNSASIDEYHETNARDELISDKSMQEIIDKAHELPYGDKLVEFLQLFVTAFKNHKHPYSGLAYTPTTYTAAVENYDLNSILSKDIKIN